MGLGGTAKKLGTMLDIAEQTYNRLNDVREQLNSLRETVERTDERFDEVELEQKRQRALLQALADKQGIDIDAALANVEPESADETTESSTPATDSPAPDNNS